MKVIEALRLTLYANRLPRTPVLQDHRFIRKSDRTVKSTSYFADGNKIKRTLKSMKDRMERMSQTNTFSHSLGTIS